MQKLFITVLFLSLFFLPAGFAQIEIEFEDEPVKVEAPKAEETPLPAIELDESMGLTNRATVEESDESMAKGIQPALIVTLEVSDNKLASKVWKDFMKDYGGKTKRSKGGNGENMTSGAEMVGIGGTKSINVYSKAVKGETGNTEMFVWFDLGDEFLDSRNRAAYNEAETTLMKYAHKVKVEHTRNELKGAEKKLKGLKGDLSRLGRQNDGYHRDIEEAKKRIARAEENIVKNEGQQVDTGKKIDLQKLLVEEIDRRLEELRKQ